MNLKKGQKMIEMNENVRQFLIGSYLGDGSFVKKTEAHNTYAVFKHCASQIGWLKWKLKFLSEQGYIKDGKQIKEVSIKEGSVFPNHQPQYTFATVSTPDFNFIKTISDDDILKHFGEFAFVVWLLDDGGVDRKTIKISTGTKSEQLCERLAERINSLLGTHCVLYKHPTKHYANYIRFKSEDFDTILDIVLKYVSAEIDIVHEKFDIECESVLVKVKYHNKKETIALMPNSDWIDLRAAETVEMKQGEYKLISLGVSMQLPENFEAHIAPRSSTFKHWGILLVNGIGIIDNSFCGDTDIWSFPALAMRDTKILEGERICQFRIIRKQPFIRFQEVERLENANRGGIGSTGR